jgi:photosystem II stability/assembly factor-like uncharacterized protein
MEGDGNVGVTATLAYSDADQDIVTMHVEMSDGTSDALPLAAVDAASGTLTEEFSVATEKTGTLDVEVWVTDAAGHTSNRLSAQIRIIDDLSTWLERESGLPNILNDVLWSGEQFLAVGDGGLIMRSENGVVWSRVDSGTTVNLNAIADFGLGYSRYLVVGDEGTVLYSEDNGENWSPTEGQGPQEVSLRTIGPSGFTTIIAAGKNQGGTDTAFIMSSDDGGRTWTIAEDLPQSGRSVTDLTQFASEASGEVRIVATTQLEGDGDNSDARVLLSSDGLNWIEVVLSTAPVSTYAILHDGDRYWAAGDAGWAFNSADGVNWSEVQTPAPIRLLALAWSGSTLIADGENEFYGWGPADVTGVATSDAGETWTLFPIAANYDSRGLAWGNGRFVSVGCAGSEEDCVGLDRGQGAIFSTP